MSCAVDVRVCGPDQVFPAPHPATPVPEMSKKPEGFLDVFLTAVKAVLPVNLLLLLIPSLKREQENYLQSVLPDTCPLVSSNCSRPHRALLYVSVDSMLCLPFSSSHVFHVWRCWMYNLKINHQNLGLISLPAAMFAVQLMCELWLLSVMPSCRRSASVQTR